MFTPIRTSRLLLRSVELGDADALFERRNETAVAEYQTWTLPYPRERVDSLIAAGVAADGPVSDDWWMATIVEAETGAIVGDLALHLTWDARSAEIGYTLARSAWGKGYATEATEALVEYLFVERNVSRVSAMLHPDNTASARVLERVGLTFEGHTRSSFWVGDDNSDDWIYGMTRPDWEAWRARPSTPPSVLRLVEITPDTAGRVARLRTHKTQERFVATVAQSYGDALFPEVIDGAPVVPWLRAIEADGEFVGFVMLALVTEHHPEPFLWRLLVDRLHQRRGVATMVMAAVFDECRAMGATTLLTSWVEGPGSPAPFHRGMGFVPTGRIVDGEIEASVTLV